MSEINSWSWNKEQPTDVPSEGVVSTQPKENLNPQVSGMVSIIIPIYNVSQELMHYTGNAIGSIKEYTEGEVPYEVILVDNGSTIGPKNPADYMVDKYILNTENKGVAYAWNQGIRMSSGEYICLMNSDAMVFGHWATDMIEGLKHVDCVMATPMYGEPFSRGVESAKKRSRWIELGYEESLSEFKDFACVMFKKSLLNEVGMFDEQFGLGYGEDVDFYRRMDKLGKKYASTKRVNIFHIIGATSSRIKEIPDIMNKNRELLKSKWEMSPELVVNDIKPEVISDEPVWGEDVPEAEIVVENVVQKDPIVIRADDTGDRVFFIKDNATNWVKSPEILFALGFDFDDVVNVSKEKYMSYNKGIEINMNNINQFVIPANERQV